MIKLNNLLKESINEGSLYSSQQLIQKLTPKIEKEIESLKKGFPHYDIDLVKNRYESDGSYTLSISGKNTSSINNNKLERAIKAKIKESVTDASKEDIIKDLDKAKNDLLKKVEILIAKKKKLYSNIDVESPISADEKKLNKDIADIFSQIQQLILQKRTIKESVNEEQPHQKEMVDGIVEMLRQVEDIENRQKMALDRLHDFKEEGIEVDAKEFLERCGLGSVNEKWSSAYKKSINCSNPKGFSQRAHCQGRKKKTESMKSKLTVEQKMELFLEKNCPTDPAKWSASKAAAKRKFDVYPSAYANGWAAKNYKSKGGGWRTCKG